MSAKVLCLFATLAAMSVTLLSMGAGSATSAALAAFCLGWTTHALDQWGDDE